MPLLELNYRKINIRGYASPVLFGIKQKSFLIIQTPFHGTNNIPFFQSMTSKISEIDSLKTVANYEDGSGYAIYNLHTVTNADTLLANTFQAIYEYFNS